MRNVAALLLLLFCMGCADDGPIADTTPDPVELDQLALSLAEVTCRKELQCCGAEEVEEHYGVSSMEECVPWAEALAQGGVVRLLMESINAGRVGYTPALMGECLLVISLLDCDEYFSRSQILLAECGAFTPRVSSGDCWLSVECETGRCDAAYNYLDEFGDCADTARLENGEPCIYDHLCESRYCINSHSSQDGVCAEHPVCYEFRGALFDSFYW